MHFSNGAHGVRKATNEHEAIADQRARVRLATSRRARANG
jgi:hypothetical protein